MRKTIFTTLLLLAAAGVVSAQEKGITGGMWYQAAPVSLNGHSEFVASDFVIAVGYAFNDRIFTRLQAEQSVGLFEVSPVRTYERSGTLGLSAGYNVMRLSDWGILECVLTVGNTVRSPNWKYAYYDMAARWALPMESRTKISLGLGVRYRQSHNDRFSNFFNFYLSVGVRLN